MNPATPLARAARFAFAAFALVAAWSSNAGLENPTNNSYQSGIGVISGWSCRGPVSVAVDGVPISVPYGGPRADAASACSGNPNVGFGLLVNYNTFHTGSHSAQLYVNGSPQGGPVQFTVTVPSGEFMTGMTKSVVVTDFPTTGKSATLVWQESQQNFAIQSVTGSSGPPSNTNYANTQLLTGGTWTFAYTIGSTVFTDSYKFTSIPAAPDSEGNYYASGTDQYGGLIVGGYNSANRVWAVLDPGTIIDQFYTFTFSDNNHVSGCYYLIDPPGSSNLSRCYSMTGVRSPYKIAAERVDPLDKLRAVEADSSLGGFIHPGAVDLYQELRRSAQLPGGN